MSATDAAKFTVWQLAESKDKQGNPVYSLKSLAAASLALDKKTGAYAATTKPLLLSAGTYYVSMESTNAAKGGNAHYSLALADASVFFTAADDGANNFLYDAKSKTLNPRIGEFVTTAIDDKTGAVALDASAPANDANWRNFVGYGDGADFAAITLTEAASLSFDVTATDAAKFTVWQLTASADKQGNPLHTAKAVLPTASLKLDKATGEYSATTKPVLLSAGTYYISVESTNAAKGGAAFYNVSVNQAKSVFYPDLFVGYDAALSANQQANGTNVVLNWTASPAEGTRKVTYFVSLDGGKENKAAKTTCTFKNLTIADHVARVYAVDEFGNRSEVSVCGFTVEDNIAPKVSGLSVSVKEKTATVKFKGTDNVAVEKYFVTLDGEASSFDAADYPAAGLAFDGLAYGNHSVTVQARDAAGNLSTVLAKDFTVKTPAGAVALDIDAASAELCLSGILHETYMDDVESGDTEFYRVEADSDGLFVFRRDDYECGKVKGSMTVYRELGDGLYAKVSTAQLSATEKKPSIKTHVTAGDVYYVAVTDTDTRDLVIDAYGYAVDFDNNRFDTATELHDYKNDNYLCASDQVDFFRFSVNQSGEYEVGVCDITSGNARQTLYDSNHNKIATMGADHDPKVMHLSAGDYYLKCEYTGSAIGYAVGLWRA